MALAVLCVISLICVYGDILLKQAGESNPVDPLKFLAAMWIYGGSTFGWLYVTRHMKLTAIGITYPVVQCFLLTGVGVCMFHESLTVRDIAGLLLGLASVILLHK
jgi:multidrug transporter EmrE-like cation transporter